MAPIAAFMGQDEPSHKCLEISRPAAIDAYQWLREVCSTTLLQTPIMLGGAGCIVQIDESLFQHKPKVDEKFSAAFVSVCL